MLFRLSNRYVVRTSVSTLACGLFATFWFLQHFAVICDLLLNRRMATWSLFGKWNLWAYAWPGSTVKMPWSGFLGISLHTVFCTYFMPLFLRDWYILIKRIILYSFFYQTGFESYWNWETWSPEEAADWNRETPSSGHCTGSPGKRPVDSRMLYFWELYRVVSPPPLPKCFSIMKPIVYQIFSED